MVTPSAAVGGALRLIVSGLARNRWSEVPYKEDVGGLLKRKQGSGGVFFQISELLFSWLKQWHKSSLILSFVYLFVLSFLQLPDFFICCHTWAKANVHLYNHLNPDLNSIEHQVGFWHFLETLHFLVSFYTQHSKHCHQFTCLTHSCNLPEVSYVGKA